MQRQQRPMGLSLLLTSIHNKQQLDDKAVYQLINYSLNHTLSYNGKVFTIDSLAELLCISRAQAYKHYLMHSSKMANLINPSDIQGLYRGQIFSLLAGASGTMRDITAQKRILQAAQGNDYVPFLTEQVNSILNTEMAAWEKMAKLAESMTKGIDANAMPTDTPNAEKAIGVSEALKLLEQNGQLNLDYKPATWMPLREVHKLDEGLPQIIANLQTGNVEDAALVKMENNKMKHKTRRAEQLNLDEEN
jgi:hypothetical protein